MAQYELNIQDYIRIIKKQRWIIILTTIVVAGAVAVFTGMQTPVYQASATVKIEPSLVIQGVSTTDQSGWDILTAINTEVKILKSTLVAERTAEKLNLLSPDMPESARAAIVSGILGKISAERIGDTNLITISATSSDPAETAKLANASAEVYIAKGIEDRNRRARELMDFVKVQMDEAEVKLKTTEDALRRYTERSGAKGVGGYLASRLMDLQNRKSDLMKRYTEQHPDVQRLKEQIAAMEQQMKQLPAEELEYARLSREVSINEELYTLLAKRYKEAQISAADRIQSAFIITPAIEPSSPIRPNRPAGVMTGIVIGIILGLILALISENLDTSIGTIEDVEKYLSLPVLGIIPHIEPEQIKFSDKRTGKAYALQSKLIVYQPPKSPFAEAYHTLRANLRFALQNKDMPQIISISSAGMAEGKTLTAANFAIAAAESGVRTLLVESDLRLPTVHKIFGLPRDPGFSDCLIGTKSWRDVVRGTTDFLMSSIPMERIIQSPGIENLRIITSGPIPPNPIDLFNSPSLGALLDDMRGNFELVVLDCSPILLFADALIVGTFATGTILIYRAGKMARGALKRAKDQLANVKAPIMGVVLNDIRTTDMEPHYGYNYSYRNYAKYPERPGS